MLKVRTKKAAQYWVPYEGANFLVEPMTMTETNRLREKFTTIKRGVEKTDFTAWFAARFDRIIKDWENVSDEDDKPLECNQKNKKLFADMNSDDAAEVLNLVADIDGNTEPAEYQNLGE